MTWSLRLLPALALLALAACADVRLGETFGDIPEAPPLSGKPLLRQASGAGREWPNLASVPPRPAQLPNLAERRQLMVELAGERAAAVAAGEALNATHPVSQPAPRPVPDPVVPAGPPPTLVMPMLPP